MSKKNIKVNSNAFINSKTVFGGQNVIHSNVNIINSNLGYATYIGKNSQLPNTEIGAYCSISNNVKVISDSHPTSKFVSTHPAFFSLLRQSGFTYATKQLFNEKLYFDQKSKIYVKIGNDVWIGANVILLGGIEIADGAIIATGSLVSKNVQPYDIVGGVPAKVIRSRFNAEQIEIVNKFKWWNKSPKWIEMHSDLFIDIETFIEFISKRESE
ncbi:MAG: CatB-related O-acetyltransferase [Flavobacterium sp.]|nr:CatB-related O-acetyltransferase [Flavobacterium sp.]